MPVKICLARKHAITPFLDQSHKATLESPVHLSPYLTTADTFAARVQDFQIPPKGIALQPK